MPLLIASVPWTFWAWTALAVLAASAIGFFAGVRHERSAAARAVEQARRSLASLIQLASQRLQQAQEACRLFEEVSLTKMTDEQAGRIDKLRGQIGDTLTRLFERRAEAKEAARLRKAAAEPFELAWTREPLDAAGYPDRSAFDANLTVMTAAATRSETSCGLLMVKVDRVHQLRSRHGAPGVERLVQKLGGVVVRSVRDADLVCRMALDTFAVLIPDVEFDEGRRLAQTVRDSIRHYHFRLDEHGDEILVTASFGYGSCEPGENAELVLNRAGNALAQSQKRGRNQLHALEGSRAAVSVV